MDVSILRFAPDTASGEWLTGGEFGIEGSAVTTIVLATAAFAAYRWWLAGRGLDRGERGLAGVSP